MGSIVLHKTQGTILRIFAENACSEGTTSGTVDPSRGDARAEGDDVSGDLESIGVKTPLLKNKKK